MNQNIITYLNENKEKYSKEVLVAELRKSGYAEGDIAEGVAQVFSLSAVAGAKEGGVTPVVAKTSFWNFKDKKTYTKASEKWADFLFGVFSPIIFGVALSIFRFMRVGWIFLLSEVVLAVYFFNRRRFIFYGLVASVVILPLILMLFIVTMFSSHGF
jgi:hypothetical protein